MSLIVCIWQLRSHYCFLFLQDAQSEETQIRLNTGFRRFANNLNVETFTLTEILTEASCFPAAPVTECSIMEVVGIPSKSQLFNRGVEYISFTNNNKIDKIMTKGTCNLLFCPHLSLFPSCRMVAQMALSSGNNNCRLMQC